MVGPPHQLRRRGLQRALADLARARRRLSDGLLAMTEPTGAGSPPSAPSAHCPWRGLAVYDVSDAPWFAGRERLVAEVLARVAGSRLVALVRPSGSGKSSGCGPG